MADPVDLDCVPRTRRLGQIEGVHGRVFVADDRIERRAVRDEGDVLSVILGRYGRWDSVLVHDRRQRPVQDLRRNGGHARPAIWCSSVARKTRSRAA